MHQMTISLNEEILKFFCKYVGEELLNPPIICTDMKSKYPFQVTDLRFQVDHINPQKIQLFEENRGATNKARLFLITFRHRKNKMTSDGYKITEGTLI